MLFAPCLLLAPLAPPDDLAAAKAYIKGEFAAHVKEMLHPVNRTYHHFLEKNCVAGYKLVTIMDFKSFQGQLADEKVSEDLSKLTKVEMRLVDLKEVEGGFGAVAYLTQTGPSANGPVTYVNPTGVRSRGFVTIREIDYQYWIKTRAGFRLKLALIRFQHFEAKDYHATIQPEFLRTIWRGPQPVLSPALLKELNVRP